MNRTEQPDVAILGGGLAGLSLAIQLKRERAGTSVVVLEKAPHPPPAAAHKVGESTVELAAFYFSKVLGLQEHLDRHQLRKYGLRFFFRSSDPSEDIARRVEVGASDYMPTPSYQLDRGLFEAFLAERAVTLGVEFVDSAAVSEVELSDDQARHRIEYRHEGTVKELRPRWVVDASGRTRLLAQQRNLSSPVSHGASAVWFRVQTRLNIDDWSSTTSWRRDDKSERFSRWFSTNHLMGPGYWVWLIPLASDATSVGIVTDEAMHPVGGYNTLDDAMHWLHRHEPVCAQHIEPHRERILDFKVIRNYSRDVTSVFSTQRWALTGEAGVFVDPFYSPGSDFIAMGNSFVADLIRRDIQGEPIAKRARIYDQLYLSYSRNTFPLFEGQYPLFGNPLVMPVKVVWDFAAYWTFLAFVFCQGRLCDLSLFVHTRTGFERLRLLNEKMQRLLRQWHEVEQSTPEPVFLDLTALEFLPRLNGGLTEALSDEEYLARLEENTALLHSLAAEIARVAGGRHPSLPVAELGGDQPPASAHLEKLFDALALVQGCRREI